MNDIIEYDENEVLSMIDDTSKLVADERASTLSSAASAAQNSTALSNQVEFWNWMSRNYYPSGIFDSPEAMQNYIAGGTGKEEWFVKQLQGKGYEWDWMTKQRMSPKNLLKRYDAGDIVNRPGSDVTEIDLLSGKLKEYQMKAYTGKTNPNLKNTPKDVEVVVNSEKAEIVSSNGYEVESFQNAEDIKRARNERLKDVKKGRSYTNYNIKNVSLTMAKSGVIGFAIGVGVETLSSYRAWKNGDLSDNDYMKEILKAGGDAGITAGATTGLMVPVTHAITIAGYSNLLTIPIAFVFSAGVNKIVAPCFGRGDYRKILNEAKYYQQLDSFKRDLVRTMEICADEYYNFVMAMKQQNEIHQSLRLKSKRLEEGIDYLDKELLELYKTI